MLWLLLVLVVVVGVLTREVRVELMAKALGQPEHRIERRLDQKKR